MKKLKKLNKAFSAFITLALVVMITAITSVAGAQSAFESVFPTSFLNNGKFDLESLVRLVFQIILYAAILWTVWNVVLAGIKIAGAKEDADKRKEGIQAVINAVIGMVVALLAFGIVSTVAGLLGTNIKKFELSTTPCVTKDGKAGFYKKEADGVIGPECNERLNVE